MMENQEFHFEFIRASIIIKLVEKRKICNLLRLAPGAKLKDSSTRKKQESANRIRSQPSATLSGMI
jgi:hypothetical protein